MENEINIPGLGEIKIDEKIKQFKHFADNNIDEINVSVGEKTIGLLKSWADPKILDISKINSHTELTTQINKILTYIGIYDQKLQEFFQIQLNSVKQDSLEYIGLIFSQMELAFKFLSAFYSIEATVDNISLAKNKLKNIQNGGEIDLIAVMLPGILESNLKNCKNHFDIEKEIENMKEKFHEDQDSIEGKKFVLISLISRKLGFSFKEIMFAGHILSIVNESSGGFDESLLDIGIKTLKETYRTTNNEGNIDSILADKNSEIRFRNWNFAIKSEDNFLGKNMNYDSVCFPSKNLFELISNNQDFIKVEHQEIFKKAIIDLKNVDATSALGRFLIWMYNENMFTEEFYNVIKSTKSKVYNIVGEIKLDNFIENPSTNIEIKQAGGKFLGIHLAREILSSDEVNIPKTDVIPWPWISEWLSNIPNLSKLISKLDNDENIDIIIQNIFEKIDNLVIPDDLLCKIKQVLNKSKNGIIFRSSALIEDVEDIGPAPGIFDSYKAENVEEIESALKNTIKSFFNKKAILFRKTKLLSNELLISILLQPFIKGQNGTIFINEKDINIDLTGTNVNDLENNQISSFNFQNNNEKEIDNNEKINKLVNIAKKLFKIFGPLDIEFVIEFKNGKNIINILQIRMLDHNKNDNSSNIEQINQIEENLLEINSIEDFGKINDSDNKKFNIIIGKEFDVAKFQNELLEKIIMLSKNINSITIQKKIAHTSHFSNIIRTLGIHLLMKE